MGEIITTQNLNNEKISSVISSDSSSWKPNDLKEILQSVSGILQTFMSVRASIMKTAEAPQMPVQTPYKESSKEENIKVIEKEVFITKPLNKDKINNLLRDLLINQADKLPEDIKEMQVKDLIGQNWADFIYNFKKAGLSFSLNARDIEQVIADNLIKSLGVCYD